MYAFKVGYSLWQHTNTDAPYDIFSFMVKDLGCVCPKVVYCILYTKIGNGKCDTFLLLNVSSIEPVFQIALEFCRSSSKFLVLI